MRKNGTKSSAALSLRDVLLTSRPFWWIATAAPFVAGYLTAGPAWEWPLVIGALYFLFFYNLLMYGVNDIFDYESDIRNPRKSGIEGAVLAKVKHRPLFLIIVLSNLPFWVYFVWIGGLASSEWLLVMILMALVYSVPRFRFKEVPLLDSITSAFHYTSPFIFGVFLAGGSHLWMPAWLAFFLWAMGNHALGAIQDIKPDREARISSIATRLGSEKTLVFCLGTYLTAAVLPTLYYGWHGLFVSIVLAWYVGLAASLVPFRMNSDSRMFRVAWKALSWLNYVAGGAVSIYLIALYHFGW
jgi:4-hydroxybenzoate polyprenyltransferase